MQFPFISDRSVKSLDRHGRTGIVIKKLDLGTRMLIAHQLPDKLAPSVPIISSHVNLNCSTLIEDQEDGDMVAAVGRVRPCPGGMNGNAHLRERRRVVLETSLVQTTIKSDDMGEAGGYRARTCGRRDHLARCRLGLGLRHYLLEHYRMMHSQL